MTLYRCYACRSEKESEQPFNICPACGEEGSVAEFRRVDDWTADVAKAATKYLEHKMTTFAFVIGHDGEKVYVLYGGPLDKNQKLALAKALRHQADGFVQEAELQG